MLDSAARSITKLGEKIEELVLSFDCSGGIFLKLYGRIKTTDAAKLQDEYAKLVEGLQEQEAEPEDDALVANPGIVLCSNNLNQFFNLLDHYSVT